MAGGVPFLLRFESDSHGVVFSRNITPDVDTGLGGWSDKEIVRALREGLRKDGSRLFLFPPHTFYTNLSTEDAHAIVSYLRTLPAIHHELPDPSLPFPAPTGELVSTTAQAPTGRTRERAEYLMSALIGCKECHSHSRDGVRQEFVGGDPIDAYNGVFRLGPDLPLRVSERGLSNFPFPGYAVLYGGNLTRYGVGGDLEATSTASLVTAIRGGISPRTDAYGRPIPLAHVMLWQFYRDMSDDDVYAIATYVKELTYQAHTVPSIQYFGEDWRSAFRQVFGELPSAADVAFFAKENR